MRSFRQIARRCAVTLAAAAPALFAAGGAGAQPPSQEDVAAGRVLALKFCTPCHVVAKDQEFAPIFKGPPKPGDFDQIAARRDTSAESLRRFLATTHSTMTLPVHMPNPELTEDETTKIVAFILSLRPQH
ncbi:MAG TPA: cytochrome c [Xanthobacteraceae bacterium]|nr:cytochrome c [Xanthobacteraceae bacterium]